MDANIGVMEILSGRSLDVLVGEVVGRSGFVGVREVDGGGKGEE